MKRILLLIIGAIIMIYSIDGNLLNGLYKKDGSAEYNAYDISGNLVFPDLPVPTGNLTSSSVPLPDIYNNGHGWTCTGLTYDADTDTFLVGDIGKELPSSPSFASQIVRVSADFETVVEEIPLYTTFQDLEDIQGLTLDSDGTIWFCSPSENLVRHIDLNGNSIGSISVPRPTGIAYSPVDNSLWVLTYGSENNIKRISKSGVVAEEYTFAYNETLDQCFLDYQKGYLYITAGANYTGRNNVYLFNTQTHTQTITCTVDSYSVEGIWIGADRMIILNDGYYHSATVQVNQANIYQLD